MNKILILLAIAFSMIAAPAIANDRPHRDRDHGGDVATGVAIGVLGTVILSEVIRDRRGDRDPRYRDRRYRDDQAHRSHRDRRYDRRIHRQRRCRTIHIQNLRGHRGNFMISNTRTGYYEYSRPSRSICVRRGQHTIIHDRNGNGRIDRRDGVAYIRGNSAFMEY